MKFTVEKTLAAETENIFKKKFSKSNRMNYVLCSNIKPEPLL